MAVRMHRVSLTLTRIQVAQLGVAAARTGKNRSALVRKAVAEWLRQVETESTDGEDRAA